MKVYSISQVSQETALSHHTLRYYESSGLLPNITKDSSGRRTYTESDLRTLRFIKALRGTNMPIKQIREYGQLYIEGKKTVKKRKRLLEEHRAKILEEIQLQKKYLQIIETKIKSTFNP
jgi:DNA-binding transcriptional MerR regulator